MATQSFKNHLKVCKVNDEVFNKILIHSQLKEKVNSLDAFSAGYKDENIVRYTDRELICPLNRLVLLDVLDQSYYEKSKYWYQVFVENGGPDIKTPKFPGTTPWHACNYVNGLLGKYYTDQEKEEIYNSHVCAKASPLHKLTTVEKGKILRFDDCYYYDINGAYASELMALFPKCAKEFGYMFEHRHDNDDHYKNVINYFIGCMTQNEKKLKDGKATREIHPETRFYIVDQISKKLVEFARRLGITDISQLLYVNTDGLIAVSPQVVLPSSSSVGNFKLEYHGTIYTYADDHSAYMQFADTGEIKGNLPLSLRDRVDLTQNKVVSFVKKRSEDGTYKCENIKEVIIH